MSAVVFTIDRDELGGGVPDRLHHELPAGDQNLFIRKTDALAGANGGIGGFETGDTDDSGHDKVDLRGSSGQDACLRTGGQFGPLPAG